MKPCITTCPASVPTDDDESPDASSATPNIVSACGPTTRPSMCEARWMSSTPANPSRVEDRRGGDQHRHVDDARRSSWR